MQMANLCYESGLCAVANIGAVDYGSDANDGGTNYLPGIDSPTGIAKPATKQAINVYRESGSSENIAIEAVGDLINGVEVFDLSGKILHKSSYSGVSRVNWQANKGLYLVKIRLQSGNSVYRKMII
jgi:hypothetical protein